MRLTDFWNGQTQISLIRTKYWQSLASTKPVAYYLNPLGGFGRSIPLYGAG